MTNRKHKEHLKRRVILLEDKLEILNRLKNGERIAAVARSLSLSQNTIGTIKRNEIKIRRSVAEGYLSCGNVTRVRDIDLIRMESALIIWFENCIKNKIALNGEIIKRQAIKLYNYLKKIGHSSGHRTFIASTGWLHRFKTRYNLHNIKLHGERVSVNIEAADKFKQEIQEIIEEGGYCQDQIFNADETALYWKKLPPRTYIFKNQCRTPPGFKAYKERITLLFCSNVAGNCLLKPLLVHRSLHPRIMKNDDMSQLPVFWYNNNKAWMTASIFKQWFFDCFVPSVENHMQKRNRSFKALLIVDNKACSVTELYHPNVKVVFLPSNCASLIQPLNQGIIHGFKAIYIRLSLQTILDKLEEDDNKTLMEAWNEFSIKDCINIISLSCKELKSSTINACWKHLLPQMVKYENVIPPADEEYSRIINIATRLGGEGLSDMNTKDVEELLMEQSLDEEELIELVDEHNNLNQSIDNNNAENINNESSSNINFNGIEKIINTLEQMQYDILEYDPLILRSSKYRRELEKFACSYKEFLSEIKKNKKIISSPEINNNPGKLVQVENVTAPVIASNNNNNNNQQKINKKINSSRPFKKRKIE